MIKFAKLYKSKCVTFEKFGVVEKNVNCFGYNVFKFRTDRPIKETNFMQSIDDIYASGAFCHLFINDLNLRIPDIFF